MMKFLFVLVFCFCSLFGRTFDDVIDEKHEQLMLQVFKGQEKKYRNIKFELDRRMVLHPKEYLFIKNCITKVFSLGESAPKECLPSSSKMYFDLSLIFPEDRFITPQEAADIFATYVYIGIKLRGNKIAKANEWTYFFKKFPDLHKRWIEVCRANCRLTQAERAYDTYDNSKSHSNTSPATSTSRRN